MEESKESISESGEALLQKIFSTLESRVTADPYSTDGSYARQIRKLPIGLRAMAATHHLDISLTLDDIGWHFLNFGETSLVNEAETGLRELGMADLATWFHEAYEIVGPLLPCEDIDTYTARIAREGRGDRIRELTRQATEQDNASCVKGSAIYGAWVKYARQHPELVFPT